MKRTTILVVIILVVGSLAMLLFRARPASADQIELLSGAKASGEVLSRTEKSITMKVTVGNVTLNKTYPTSAIHAVTIGDKREVLNEKAGSPSDDKPAKTAEAASADPAKARAALDALIDKAGRTPPDWFAATALNYPKTLDLSWPQKPPQQGWNPQLNVGQYVWDIINPNPNRWREGVRLMHHLLVMHQDDQEKRERISRELARMYHDLIEDYARSAFWYRQMGVDREPEEYTFSAAILAECYWKLGSKEAAAEILNKIPSSLEAAKVWADMGDVDKAIKLAEAQVARIPDDAYIVAGDACRMAGRFQEALGFYRKVLSETPADGKGWIKKNRERAQANIDAITLFDAVDLAKVKDGKFSAQSLGYSGPVHIAVTVSSQRIQSVVVTQHVEKQFYSALTDTPRKIIEKQGVKGVDATSAATLTSEAIINATAKALASGAN